MTRPAALTWSLWSGLGATPDFSSPGFRPGRVATSTVTVTSLSGFSNAVALIVFWSGQRGHLRAQLGDSRTGSATSTLTVNTVGRFSPMMYSIGIARVPLARSQSLALYAESPTSG